MPSPRLLLYSHDTYGLGHLRRNLAIATKVAEEIEGSRQLLVTGSMVAGAFTLPPRFDMIKLPAISKRSNGQYEARTLPLSCKKIIQWREDMILQAAINFAPDIVLVDKSPTGVQGELLPTLTYLKAQSPHTKWVFGMRDIEDSPEKTRAEWTKSGAYELFDSFYDAILLYGQRDVFDPIDAYDLSEKASAKVIETGYLGRSIPESAPQWVRKQLDIDTKIPLVVVTVGGGGDGYKIVDTVLKMANEFGSNAPFHTVIVTGPLMKASQQNAAQRLASHRHITVIDFTTHLLDYMAAADVVVSMAGYNTTVELLSLGKQTILIPRNRIRAEQHMRAQRLAHLGLIQHLPADLLSPTSLLNHLIHAVSAAPPEPKLNLDGLQNVANALKQLVSTPATSPATTAAPLPLVAFR